jgi:hypothetical protein
LINDATTAASRLRNGEFRLVRNGWSARSSLKGLWGSSLVARQAYNLKVVGSNPAPATNLGPETLVSGPFLLVLYHFLHFRHARMKQGEHREIWGSKTNTTITQLVHAEGLESAQ